jgi:hypothetical protein
MNLFIRLSALILSDGPSGPKPIFLRHTQLSSGSQRTELDKCINTNNPERKHDRA